MHQNVKKTIQISLGGILAIGAFIGIVHATVYKVDMLKEALAKEEQCRIEDIKMVDIERKEQARELKKMHNKDVKQMNQNFKEQIGLLREQSTVIQTVSGDMRELLSNQKYMQRDIEEIKKR